MRSLRTYRRMAQQEHHCDTCQTPIWAGELYEGEVVVMRRDGRKKTVIVVFRQHVEPRCEPPPFPEDDKRFEHEDDGEVAYDQAA